MKKQKEKKYHCLICREIEVGCDDDRVNPISCSVCHRKGFIDLGDGTAICCDSCPRGYRLKLWLKHEGRENGPIKVAA